MSVAIDVTAGEEHENGTRSQDPPSTVVAIGASAGGLEALFEFFDHMAGDSGFAFVVVLHLPRNRQSFVSRLIARHTAMPVCDVRGSVTLAANHVYVAPPGASIAFDGHTIEAVMAGNHRLPKGIDETFASLARAWKERAVAIVLSGNGADGVRGLAAIDAEHGTIFVQSETSARHASMPVHAAATGLADHVGSPAELPSFLTQSARASENPTTASLPVRSPIPRLFGAFLPMLAPTILVVRDKRGAALTQ